MAKKPETPSRIADNKKAAFNYFFEERHEAGVVLQGWEVKSLRAGRTNLTDAYAIVPDAAALPLVLKTLVQLRALGVSVQMHAGAAESWGSMKSQFKKADASGARHALIFGGDELARGEVTVKSLRDGAGAQQARSLSDLPQWAITLQSQN